MNEFGHAINIVKHITDNRRIANVCFNYENDTLYIVGKLESNKETTALISFDRSGNIALHKNGVLTPINEKIDYGRFSPVGDPTFFEFKISYGDDEYLKLSHMLPPIDRCVERSPYIEAEILVSRHLLSTPSFIALLKS